MTCWDTKSPLVTVFLMKCLCSIPFLIAMIIAYIVFGLLVKHGNYDCDDVCRGRIDICDESAITYKSCYTPQDEVLNPIMASISEAVFADDLNPAKFKCPAVILTPKHAITSSKCVENIDLKEIYLRSASNYWSKGGIVHRIEKILRPNDQLSIVGLEITPYFPLIEQIRFARIEKFPSKIEDIRTFHWKVHVSEHPPFGVKFLKLQEMDLDLTANCTRKEFEITCKQNNSQCSNLHPGSPLLNEENRLLGFLMDVNCKHHTLLYHEIGKYYEWLENMLGFNNSAMYYAPCNNTKQNVLTEI